ncbi:carbohydrate kinase family protein [Aeoliella mucimassa]|uniref:Putative sugar kinase YdjH n=1 Tax=Aeoliella mucimassa TaxID=2527972 RepID=A0A518AQI2_9BACT|nr:carbohydrate kinase family protein [Aeoliella mucimassa]QDU56980.1 putative sugar kinase YdjH [Aeoliella mucimassa]
MCEQRSIDVLVCGTAVLDIVVKPVELQQAIGGGKLFKTSPLSVHAGGIVANCGAVLARHGMRVSALTVVGNDVWGEMLRERMQSLGIEVESVVATEGSTSTSIVLVDESGQRSFGHHVGVLEQYDLKTVQIHSDLLTNTKLLLVGYLALLPELEKELPSLFRQAREAGCLTALEPAGSGGDVELLKPCLPWLDYYFPSKEEAYAQTGESDPAAMIAAFRDFGAAGVVGVKLGADGVVVSERPGQLQAIAAVEPPGKVVDTTGAGDCFLGAFLGGRLRGMDCTNAAKLGAAAGASCVTQIGAQAGLLDLSDACQLAGVPTPEASM